MFKDEHDDLVVGFCDSIGCEEIDLGFMMDERPDI